MEAWGDPVYAVAALIDPAVASFFPHLDDLSYEKAKQLFFALVSF
jgi:hypothetical protein